MEYLTQTVVMVFPEYFGFNSQTAQSNPFQHEDSNADVHTQAQTEFSNMVNTLKEKGVKVIVLSSRSDVITPDAIFPNNWFSHHQDGTLIIYPMLAENRRAERQIKELRQLLFQEGLPVSKIIDLSPHEEEGRYLEGTGSLVLDRKRKVAFGMESPRTVKKEFEAWCKKMGYKGILFRAYDSNNVPIYHTNVTMNIGDQFVIICLESIKDTDMRTEVVEELERIGKVIIPITMKQMNEYCGNVLQLKTIENKRIIVMSTTAYSAFTPSQVSKLEQHGEIVSVDVPTIERIGGGSARCMMAEVFGEIH